MEKMKIIFLVSFLVFCPLSLSTSISGTLTHTEKSDVENFVFALFDEVKEMAAIQNDLEKDQKIRGIIDAYFTKNRIAQLGIGFHWKEMSDVQKKEFIDVFSDYMIFSFIPNIETFLTGQVQIDHISKRRKVNSSYDSYSVNIGYTTARRKKYEISIAMLESKEKDQTSYKIYDVAVDKIHFSTNLRSSFKNSIYKRGFRWLIKSLEKSIKVSQEIRKLKKKYNSQSRNSEVKKYLGSKR